MKQFLSAIVIFLACFGFTAKLMQLDKFYGTELMAKECNAADENWEKEKKEKKADEQDAYHPETDFSAFAFTDNLAYHHSFYSKGYVSSLYNPPDPL